MPNSLPQVRVSGLTVAVAVLASIAAIAAAGPKAGGLQEQVPEPYSVFVSRAGEVDAELDVRLTNAVTALAAELGEQPQRFRLVESAEEADVRVTIFDAQAVTSELRHVGGPAGFTPNRVFESRGSNFFSFDAVVRMGRNRKQVRGSGTGATETGSFRSAASDFVRQFETFAHENSTGTR